jgi:hypothetical protein
MDEMLSIRSIDPDTLMEINKSRKMFEEYEIQQLKSKSYDQDEDFSDNEDARWDELIVNKGQWTRGK